ncbi:hypothetical protein Cgig2_026579 [Carnegiea gigantea]|uniref:DUF8040 domain-containing protein n=1 Tax=Carnegiea gigantea TaxID=171969 RepID=A0A9Q1QLF6_9CARY|nr:hypothetical protein Cgig2_026579 [Carnegiea gigantea]
MLKNEGINKESIQIKNRCNDLRKKLEPWEFLIGKTGVGVDYKIDAVIVSDSTWQDFLPRYGGKYKSFQKKVPANLEKMKSAFYRKQATGEISFAPGMVTSPSNQTQRSTGKALDMDEHVGDSDEANEDGSDARMKCLRVEESRSPPKSVHSSCKRKSEGGTSSDSKRQELLNWSSRDERMDEDDYRMDEENCAMDAVEDHAIDTILADTLRRNHPTYKERLSRVIDGESGVKYIHRLLNGNRPDLRRKVLRLDKDVFTHLVNIFIERRLLKDGRFIKAAEIVAITLLFWQEGLVIGRLKIAFNISHQQ